MPLPLRLSVWYTDGSALITNPALFIRVPTVCSDVPNLIQFVKGVCLIRWTRAQRDHAAMCPFGCADSVTTLALTFAKSVRTHNLLSLGGIVRRDIFHAVLSDYNVFTAFSRQEAPLRFACPRDRHKQ